MTTLVITLIACLGCIIVGYLAGLASGATATRRRAALPANTTPGEPSPRPWRVGGHWGRTIITQGDPLYPQGRLIGVMDNPVDAADIVALANTIERQANP